MYNKGDVVVGLESANGPYAITKYNTQWIVYDSEYSTFQNRTLILVGNTVTGKRYIERQRLYDELFAKQQKNKGTNSVDIRHDIDFDTHLVDPQYFGYVHSLMVHTNQDAVRLLHQEDSSVLEALKGLRA